MDYVPSFDFDHPYFKGKWTNFALDGEDRINERVEVVICSSSHSVQLACCQETLWFDTTGSGFLLS